MSNSRRISERVLAVILAALLMAGMLPVSAFAEVLGTHEDVFTFSVTTVADEGTQTVEGAEITYTVTTQKDGEEPSTSGVVTVATGEDGVADIVENLPETLEDDVTVTIDYTIEASGYKTEEDTYTVGSLTDNVAVTMTAIPTVAVTAAIAGKGSVKVGDTQVDAERPAAVAEGTVATITVTPYTGYEIASLSIGETSVAIDNTNKASYETAHTFETDTKITVTFKDVEVPVLSNTAVTPEGWAKEKTVTVTASDNSGSYTVSYYLDTDEEPDIKTAEGDSFTVQSAGTYKVYVEDAAGNKSTEQTVAVNEIDRDDPLITELRSNHSILEGWVSNVTLSGTVSDDDGSGVSKVVFGTSNRFDLATDEGVTFNAGTYSFTVSATGEYYIWAVDAAGNVSDCRSMEVGMIDSTAPAIDKCTVAPKSWTKDSVTVKVEASDHDESGVNAVRYSQTKYDPNAEYATKGEDGVWTFDIERLGPDGKYTCYVWAVDGVGIQSDVVTVTASFDGTAPTVTITTVPSDTWTNGDVTIEGTVAEAGDSDNASGLEKVVYGTEEDPDDATGEATVKDGSYSFTVSANGTYNVWALDKAGNYSEVKSIPIDNIDKEKPEVTVEKEEYPWSMGKVTVSGTASDTNGSGVVAVLYNTSDDIQTAKEVTEFTDGTYSFDVANDQNVNDTYYIWSRDAAGNDSEPATRQIRIDITAPEIEATPETFGSGSERKTVVRGRAADNEEGDKESGIQKVVYATENNYDLATDEGVTLDEYGTYEFTVPSDPEFKGKYYFWAVDNAGNSSEPASVDVTVDFTAPVIDEIQADPNGWTNEPVTISGSVSDNLTSVKEVKYAAENDITKATTEEVTSADDSTFTFTFTVGEEEEFEFNGDYYVWVIDECGNESDSTAVKVQIDRTKPTATFQNQNRPWDKLLEALTFGLYSNTEMKVTIEPKDGESQTANSGWKTVEYIKVTGNAAPNPLSREDLEQVTQWKNGDTFTVTEDEVYVVYAKVTDNAGNYDYFSSDGAIRDSKPVSISLTPPEPVADNGVNGVYGYYNKDVTVAVTVKETENSPYSGIQYVEYWITADGVETKRDMTLLEMKKKVLGLIEELNPESELLTDDPDISTKLNDVINQIMFELSRFKKIPKYVELEVRDGDVIEFADLEQECGCEIYQLGLVSGVGYTPKANGTVLKIRESGTAEIDCYVYPERITGETKDEEYEFELTNDVLEIMPYGIAADLLKSDVSTEYGKIYANRYESMIQLLDPRYQLASISIEGGVDV